MTPRTRQEFFQNAITSGEVGAVAAQTVMVTLLPVLLARYTSSALLIGAAVGGEGVFALTLPVWSGMLSDRIGRHPGARLSGRMVVVSIAAILLASSTAIAPFIKGYWASAGIAFVSFAALHAYLTPFWALTIDAVPDERRGRVQGVRGILRSVGLAYGLVVAGLLFGISRPLPFLVAGLLVVATTTLSGAAARAVSPARHESTHKGLGQAWRSLIRNRPALWLLAADACWNASVDGIRPYFYLYAKNVLGTTVRQTSIGLLLLVIGLAGGSWFVGRLGDRYDRMRLLQAASLGLAIAFALGFTVRSIPVSLLIAGAAGLAASAIMTLPLPLYANLVGDQSSGENTGLYVVSVTIGRVCSPLLVGGAVDLSSRFMPQTHGYPVMWLVSCALALAGWRCVRISAHAVRERARIGSPHAKRVATTP